MILPQMLNNGFVVGEGGGINTLLSPSTVVALKPSKVLVKVTTHKTAIRATSKTQ